MAGSARCGASGAGFAYVKLTIGRVRMNCFQELHNILSFGDVLLKRNRFMATLEMETS